MQLIMKVLYILLAGITATMATSVAKVVRQNPPGTHYYELCDGKDGAMPCQIFYLHNGECKKVVYSGITSHGSSLGSVDEGGQGDNCFLCKGDNCDGDCLHVDADIGDLGDYIDFNSIKCIWYA